MCCQPQFNKVKTQYIHCSRYPRHLINLFDATNPFMHLHTLKVNWQTSYSWLEAMHIGIQLGDGIMHSNEKQPGAVKKGAAKQSSRIEGIVCHL